MKSIGEISIAPPVGGISGILVARERTEHSRRRLSIAARRASRDRLRPLAAIRFFLGGQGCSRGGASGHPSPCPAPLDAAGDRQTAETVEVCLRASHRAHPTGTGSGPPRHRRNSPSWKTARFPRGSGKPYGAIGERGFPPPAPLACGSLRPRPRRPHGAAAGKRASSPGNRQKEKRADKLLFDFR
jgi:hypothetical protein